MGKYLYRASYTHEGVKGLIKEGGSSRASTIADLIKSMGGTLESFHFAFGGDDVVAIVDLPDEEAAIALSLAVAAGGAVGLSTTVLIDPATVDAATKKVVSYRPPGA